MVPGTVHLALALQSRVQGVRPMGQMEEVPAASLVCDRMLCKAVSFYSKVITYWISSGHWNLTQPGYSNPVPVTQTSRLPGYCPGSHMGPYGPMLALWAHMVP